MARLPVKVKYAVKFSITNIFKFDRKWRKRYNGRLEKSKCGHTSIISFAIHFSRMGGSGAPWRVILVLSPVCVC